jgi:hypothetical protein
MWQMSLASVIIIIIIIIIMWAELLGSYIATFISLIRYGHHHVSPKRRNNLILCGVGTQKTIIRV